MSGFVWPWISQRPPSSMPMTSMRMVSVWGVLPHHEGLKPRQTIHHLSQLLDAPFNWAFINSIQHGHGSMIVHMLICSLFLCASASVLSDHILRLLLLTQVHTACLDHGCIACPDNTEDTTNSISPHMQLLSNVKGQSGTFCTKESEFHMSHCRQAIVQIRRKPRSLVKY